jgi:hypothetical protein
MNPHQKGQRAIDSDSKRYGHLADANRILFTALLAEARRRREAGDFEQTLGWCSAAAWFASTKGWFGELSSAQLENEILTAARSLPRPARKTRPGAGRPRWLHVMTEAYATLGHTNLCRRWMELDSETVHDVILLHQENGAPANLQRTVEAARGRCVVLDRAAPVLDRAMELRDFAWANADVVVLHTHPDDVIAATAFGIEGGPPVLFVNHADHVFWVGCGIADLVLDIRLSGHVWTRDARGGANRCMILPIPLEHKERTNQRQRVRRNLSVPDEAILFLTVGSAAKYKAIPGLDFVAAAREIIHRCPNAYLVAIGPEDVGPWKAARIETEGRIAALGRQADSRVFCEAADIYLEGFPLGSLTALLEAGLAGLPCVRGPETCVGPFTSDSGSLDVLHQPSDVQDYITHAVYFAGHPEVRVQASTELQSAVDAQHCGDGWLRHLSEVKKRIPPAHFVHPDFNAKEVDIHMRDWFLRFLFGHRLPRSGAALASGALIEAWQQTKLKPLLDPDTFRRLHGRSAAPEPRGKTASAKLHPFEALALWAWNQRIRYCGGKEKLVSATREWLETGQRLRALVAIWRCLLFFPSSLTDPAWLRLWLKAHLGGRMTARIRRLSRG